MISCKEVIHQLWDYLDGECTAEFTESIREHLALCAGCRAVSEFEEAFLQSAQGLMENPPTDSELRSKVMAALRQHGYRGTGA